MSINFPSSLDSLSNPTSTDLLDNASAALDHWTQHSDANDAIEALEAKVGVNNSAVTTSHDYKLSGVTGSDKASSLAGAETLSNKTLSSPKVTVGSDAAGDTYYRNGSGNLVRVPIGTSTYVLTSDGSVPSWQANAAGANASTTVKGVVELATLAETIARTTDGGTGAKLVVTPDNLTTVLTYDYQADSVGTDSYAITCTPAPTAYTSGMRFTFKAGTANTGACTLNVNSLGAKTIKKQYNIDLSTGDILANQIIEVVYDGTNFQLVSAQQPRPLYNSGHTNRDLTAATGTQTIAHGLGVTPRYVRITYTEQLGNSTTAPVHYGTGTYNGSTYSNQYSGTSASETAGRWNLTQSTSDIIAFKNGGSGTEVSQVATISAMDSTNITLSWTKTNSPTGTLLFQWEAYY